MACCLTRLELHAVPQEVKPAYPLCVFLRKQPVRHQARQQDGMLARQHQACQRDGIRHVSKNGRRAGWMGALFGRAGSL